MHKRIFGVLLDNKHKHYTTLIIFVAILALGLFLRLDRFDQFPRHGATFDEFAWTWLGVNLIQERVPISWSPHPQYKERKEIRYQGAAFLLVKPYLEHPPLFGLVAGSFALANGARDMYDITLSKIRPLALILGILSIAMVFLLTLEIYGRRVALLSSLLYATIPTVVIGSRIVQNENFLIPMWLLCLYLIQRYLKTEKTRFRNIAAIAGGLLSLAKVPWLVVPLSLSMILSFKNKWKDAFLIGFVAIGFFSLFLAYGFYFDRELFINLWKLQLSRYDISFAGFFGMFQEPLIVDRIYLDGWILFGWLTVAFLLKDLKNNFMIAIPFIAYLIVYIFAVPNEAAHGWYRFPFYPFLIISIATVMKDEFKRFTPVSIVFFLFVGLLLLSNTWESLFGFSYDAYRAFIILSTAPALLIIWKNLKGRAPNLLVTFFLIILIALNIASVLTYIE